MTCFQDPDSSDFARLTGLFYLLIAIFGAFAIAYVPSQLVTPGDPAASLSTIAARPGLFLAGIGADLVVISAEIVITAMLFHMFRDTSPTLSLAAASARLSMVAVMAAQLFLSAATALLADPQALPMLTPETRTALAALSLHLHGAGVWIWQVFFTLHLLILGALVAGSGCFPVLLGRAMQLGAFGYLADSLHAFAFPEAQALGYLKIALLVVVTLAELGFALWLVIRAPARATVS